MSAAQLNLPMISIVTPTRNRGAMIGAAIESVLAQGYPAVEHIIVDAMSTDDTAQVLGRFPHLRIIREPDRGIYDGLNKGIRAARGEIIGHLNSDDVYCPGAFLAVARRFKAGADIDVVSGSATISALAERGGRQVTHRFDKPADRRLDLATGTTGAALPNARFFRRRVYDRVGLYDPSFTIAADRDFLIRAALAGVKSAELDQVVYDYLAHPGSVSLGGSSGGALQSYADLLRLAERYMRDPTAPDELRRRCVALHRQATRGSSLASLASGDWRAMGRVLRRGLQSDALWPLRFGALAVRRGVPAVLRRVSRPAP